MSGQFQTDVDALNQFAKDLADKGGLIDQIRSDPALKAQIESMATNTYRPGAGSASFTPGPIDFGQSIGAFTSARTLRGDYEGKYDGFTANVNDFLNALTVLAEAAKTIAGNYGTATAYDQVGVQSVQDAFSNAKPA